VYLTKEPRRLHQEYLGRRKRELLNQKEALRSHLARHGDPNRPFPDIGLRSCGWDTMAIIEEL
jgi:hypothetical protein